MAELENLKKFRKHQVDEKRKVLANLYKESEALDQKKQNILDEIDTERTHVANSDDHHTQSYFNTYLESMKGKIEILDNAREKMKTRIDFAREDVRNAFAEFKKIEITQRERKKKERKALDKKESDELDEIAIEGFRRKEDE